MTEGVSTDRLTICCSSVSSTYTWPDVSAGLSFEADGTVVGAGDGAGIVAGDEDVENPPPGSKKDPSVFEMLPFLETSALVSTRESKLIIVDDVNEVNDDVPLIELPPSCKDSYKKARCTYCWGKEK